MTIVGDNYDIERAADKGFVPSAAQQKKKFWRNRVHVISSESLEKLRDELNDFYKDKFVVATQVFPLDWKGFKEWHAIVYYKIPPEEQ